MFYSHESKYCLSVDPFLDASCIFRAFFFVLSPLNLAFTPVLTSPEHGVATIWYEPFLNFVP